MFLIIPRTTIAGDLSCLGAGQTGFFPAFELPFLLVELTCWGCLLLAFLGLFLALFLGFLAVMNFVCNLRRLGIYDQLVVAAWDADMYR